MNKERTKKDLKLTIDKDLLELVRPYINNLSAYFESCLKNFYKANKPLIDSGDFKTSKYLVDLNIKVEDSPNITYIMQNLPVQLSLLPIVENRVINVKKKRILNLPSVEDPIFLSNNSLKLKDKIYYFEVINNFTSKDNKSKVNIDDYVFDESDKWWK